ncbi:efflux RND transporter periplasmic adaptor subunit [Caulobacter sp. 17J65-9]|uniref:efflux RND transporter periplasmic adaptor subunit n=1 Tax=Caulobacter sp. 17J65-9 TaxID=2709382 RepID=UPI0013C87B96|nr:efflux RND transporter periplasmic adaptor subunit [Caulobacter sp. 17J65-9]
MRCLRTLRWSVTAALIAVALSACHKGEEKKTEPRAVLTVTAEAVRSEALPRTVDASGTVAPWREIPVAAETGGLTAVAVNVDEGDYVSQGQTLVKLNDEVLQAQLRQQTAAVASARARLAEAEANLKRSRELNRRGYLSTADLDSRTAEQGTASADVAAAIASRAETAARLDQTVIRAPVAGLVSARAVVKGQIVVAGTELFRVVRDGRLELNAEVPEADLGLVRPGQSAQVTAAQAGTVAGSVRIVTPQVDPQTRLGLARVALPARSAFSPGMFARARIDVGAQPALTVPLAAVVYREDKAGVFVVGADERAHFRSVTTGARAEGRVEITAGLKAGERVAVQGAGFLADGDRVRIGVAPTAART